MKRWITISCLILGAAVAPAEEMFFFRFFSSTASVMIAGAGNGTVVWSNDAAATTGRFQRATSMNPTNDWLDYVQCAVDTAVATQRLFDLATPEGMAYIPAGTFQMGDTFGDASALECMNEEPVHTLFLSEFYMDKTEVTKGQWDQVFNWAVTNGYDFDNVGSWADGANIGKGDDHPVICVNWFDCVKWCNARSELEGKIPVYTTNGAVFRTGSNYYVDCAWTISGYRLPTEAEWERAARGGSLSRRFPWPDSDEIQHARANYNSTNYFAYDTSDTSGYSPSSSSPPYTAPVGSYSPNTYGIYDMAGNVWEWCWDLYDYYWYTNAEASAANTRGPTTSVYRVFRGGSGYNFAWYCRNSIRYHAFPRDWFVNVGFRTVLFPDRSGGF